MKIYVFAAVAAFGVSGSVFAQTAPNPRTGATTPVQVVNDGSNPVPVTGTVTGEVKVTNSLIDVAAVNDIVNTPYMVSHSSSFVGGNASQFEFDIPEGMRLIVETITVRFALETPGNAVLQFRVRATPTLSQFGEIAVLPQGTITDSFGNPTTWLVATHAIKLRLDAQPGRDDELVIVPRLGVVDGTANAFVAGYLVPIQ